MHEDGYTIRSWSARLIADGATVSSDELDSIERVHERGGCDRLTVWLDGVELPLHVSCSPENGEKIRMFTRRAIVDATTPQARQVNMPVLEVSRPSGWTRLYAHHQHGLVLSTLNLNI